MGSRGLIYPGEPWLDTEGKPIQAHGAGMCYVDGTYYWYGENKEFTDGKSDTWTYGTRAYASRDLVSWEDKGLIVPPDLEDPASTLHPTSKLDRPHIVRDPASGVFVMWLKVSCEPGYFAVMRAENILGPWEMVRDHVMPFGLAAGDFDLWVDPKTGEGFLYFEHDHAGLAVCRLSEDLLDPVGPYEDYFCGLVPPYVREGVTHVFRDGLHYLLTSGMTGYVPNPSEVAVSESPMGPWRVLGNPHRDDPSSASFNSQISYAFDDPERPGLTLVMADRWVPDFVVSRKRYERMERVIAKASGGDAEPSPLDYLSMVGTPFLGSANTSKARYVWLPLRFDEKGPYLTWESAWSPDDWDEQPG